MMNIQRFNELNDNEIIKILKRESLDISKVAHEVITPMAHAFQQNAWKALQDFALKYEGFFPEKPVLKKQDLQKALNAYLKKDPRLVASFENALANIRQFHEKQKLEPVESCINSNTLGIRYVPFDNVALYVPGGKAIYPSTVMMGITPALIAGVKNITLVCPPEKKSRETAQIVQAIACLAGADKLLQAGGAQAIFAMAYGIPELEIAPVDFICGPGNIYVAAAKASAFAANLCGIDSFAGPSEVIIIADHSANPKYVAYDLLAQAEHDENATAILLTTSEPLAQHIPKLLEEALAERGERREVTEESVRRNGKILIMPNLQLAIDFCNRYAPEHLEIMTECNDEVLKKINCAGSVFCGDYSPVAAGDYYSGTNHILPTGGAARYASGLGVQSFYRRITYQKLTREGLRTGAQDIARMSKAEGLFDEHGYSVLARFPNDKFSV